MRRKITLAVFTLLTCFLSLNAQANYVHRVIVLNEGYYDYPNQVQVVPVTIGSFDPVTHIYSVFDTIYNSRFASDVIVDGSSIYVAADNKLIRYDADTYQRLFTATVPGIRKLAVWNNQVLVSRGEYLQTYNSYFQVYDKNNLGFVYDLPASSGPQYASSGIVVRNDTAFIAINNGFDWGNEVGFVGRINLVSQAYVNEIDLGVDGKNPEAIRFENNSIYTVNYTDFSTTSISSIDPNSQLVNTVNLNTATGCGASAFAPGFVLFQLNGDNQLRRFNTTTFGMHDTLQINRSIYGMVTDPINNLIYIGETDYTSYGKVFVHDFTGITIDSFDVSIAPGNIALDMRSTAGIVEAKQAGHSLSCSPNPVLNETRITLNGDKNFKEDIFILADISGREVKRIVSDQSSFLLDIQSLDGGIYILSSIINADEKVKIIKQ